jgi:type IV secretion system protein VirD4
LSAWEDRLRAETPRGYDGREDEVPYAGWAKPGAIDSEWEYTRKKMFLGYRWGQAVGCGDDRHVMLVAGSRAGKGVSIIIPNMLAYEGPVLALDPKGELAELTARRRAEGMGQKVYVLDPFDRSGPGTLPWRASFNPLKEIDPTSRDAVDDAALVADALIVTDLGSSADRHWTDAARELVKLLILDALTLPEERRHLGHVRDFFHEPGAVENGKQVSGQVMRLLTIAQEKERAFDGVLAGAADAFATKNDRELGSIISTAQVQLGFLDSAPLMDVLRKSSFRLADLKNGKVTVYLCLPASHMATHGKWFRIVVSLALLMCERIAAKPSPPLLMLLEEFPVLGYLRPLEAAAGQIAGFGVKLFTVLQDLTQLQRHYDKGWETFFGNSGAQIFFGNSDLTTLDYVSRKVGTIGFDISRPTGASAAARLAGAKTFQEQLQLNRLLEPHEVERMFARETKRALVLYSGRDPLIVQRAIYHEDKTFRKLRE